MKEAEEEELPTCRAVISFPIIFTFKAGADIPMTSFPQEAFWTWSCVENKGGAWRGSVAPGVPWCLLTCDCKVEVVSNEKGWGKGT